MVNNLTWNNFATIHPNTREAFEQLCRILFKRQFFDKTSVLTSNPNNPGVEVIPKLNSKMKKTISFQAKYFENTVNYEQIKKSVEKTIKNYNGKLDVFYLYSNRDLTSTSKGYKTIEKILTEANIELIVISNSEIISEVIKYTDLQLYFFNNHELKKEWFEEKNKLSFDSLGRRYNPEFNVETKTEEKIQLFTRNSNSIKRINETKINFIEKITQLRSLRDMEIILKIKKFIDELEDVSKDTIEQYVDWNTNLKDSISVEINDLHSKKEELLLSLKNSEKDSIKIQSETIELDNKIREINILEKYIETFGCSEEEYNLISERVIVITGDAGMGKSQLLATTTNEILDNGGYALLLLGHRYISSQDIKLQIKESLGLNCDFYKFLDRLNVLGEIENKKIYIFIDALNETPNKNVWKNGITDIIFQINKRNNLKLVLSVRSGYERIVFEESIVNDIDSRKIIKIIHSGIQDTSVKAIRKFLDYHNIVFSPVDLLNYRMDNPLFLTQFCQTYNGEEQNIFQIFDRFIEIADEEIQKEIGISDSGSVLRDLLLEIANWQLENDSRYIDKKSLFRLDFWQDYGVNKLQYLQVLVKSEVIKENVIKEKEVYDFSYNLLEDYMKAKSIINRGLSKDKLVEYIKKELLNIQEGVINRIWNIDIFIFISCFYFKKYNEDCIVIINEITDDFCERELAERYIKSYAWRPDKYGNKELFKKISLEYHLDTEIFFDVLIQNSTKEHSILNAKYLHEILYSLHLNNRDCVWIPYINNLVEDESRVFQLITLFNEGERIDNLSKEQTKLLLTLFTWFLASSNRNLRDLTSKAMVEILKVNFDLCKYLLRKFENVNDPYIIQRLYGVVFGACTKRVEKFEVEYKKLSNFVYTSIFDKEYVYPDILLRDYARLIIERYLFEFSSNESTIEKKKIFPPYNSDKIPNISNGSDEYEGGLDLIANSMRPEDLGWYGDFGRYVFQSALNYFNNVDIKNLYYYAMHYIKEELGYSNELFSEYDVRHGYFYDMGRTPTIERIGKKYQWIAFYNILARVSDLHTIKDLGSDVEKEFKGPWEPYVRDFDPTINVNFRKSKEKLPEFNIQYQEDFIDDNTNDGINKWVSSNANLFDMPIMYKDEDSKEWILLYQHKQLENNATKNSEKKEDYHRVWRILEAYFVKKSEFNELKNHFENIKDFKQGVFSGSLQLYQIYNREFSWSESVKDIMQDHWIDYNVETGDIVVERQKKVNFEFNDNIFQISESEEDVEIKVEKNIAKMLRTYNQFTWEEEYDASKNETISFDIPCIELIDELKLVQKEYDGYYYSENDELVAFDGEKTGTINGLVIRKDYLKRYLKENDMCMFWRFVGEKQHFIEYPKGQTWSRWHRFYWLDEKIIRGNTHIEKGSHNI